MSVSVDALAKRAAAEPAHVAAIIKEALSAPGLVAFGELLAVPSVQAAGVPFQQLEVFAYGTWLEYHKAGLPALEPAQARKLRQLTLASLAARTSHLGYDLLRTELGLTELRELGAAEMRGSCFCHADPSLAEDLVLDTVYQGLIEAKIDQRSQQVIVDFAIGRDVRDVDLVRIQTVLKNWLARSTTIMKVIEDKISIARSEIKVEQMRREEFDARVKDVKENIRAMVEAQEAEQRAGMRRQLGGPGGPGGPSIGVGPGAALGGFLGGGGGNPGRRDPRGHDPRDPRRGGKGF